ncbi:hypothetical protein PHYC_01804 [Phycisphaerales bacterium]|nr:hypothetical protein PHYC_01804 [Phycisphaerales bacterium]
MTGVINRKTVVVRTVEAALPRFVQSAVDANPRPLRIPATKLRDGAGTDRNAKLLQESGPLIRRIEVALVVIRLERSRPSRCRVVLVLRMPGVRHLLRKVIRSGRVGRPIGESPGLVPALVLGPPCHSQVYRQDYGTPKSAFAGVVSSAGSTVGVEVHAGEPRAHDSSGGRAMDFPPPSAVRMQSGSGAASPSAASTTPTPCPPNSPSGRAVLADAERLEE